MRWVKLQRAGRGSCAVGREDDEAVLWAAGDAVVARARGVRVVSKRKGWATVVVEDVRVVVVVVVVVGGSSFRWLVLPKNLLMVMVWAQPE